MRDASEVVCLDTEAEICKSVAEAFRQGRTSVEVGDRLFLWGGAVPGNTEEQVAKIIAEKIKRREAEQTQMMNLMSERAQKMGLIKPGGPWDKIPATMCRWGCTRECARMVWPDVVTGVYTPDEIAQGELPEEMIATMVSRG